MECVSSPSGTRFPQVGTLPSIYHWNGTEWTVSAPKLQGGGRMTGVSALAGDDVWMVGDSPGDHLRALHWDGVRWTQVPAAARGLSFKVAADAPGMAWAAGQWGDLCGGGEPSACEYVIGRLNTRPEAATV
jgi:hypothetical protein